MPKYTRLQSYLLEGCLDSGGGAPPCPSSQNVTCHRSLCFLCSLGHSLPQTFSHCVCFLSLWLDRMILINLVCVFICPMLKAVPYAQKLHGWILTLLSLVCPAVCHHWVPWLLEALLIHLLRLTWLCVLNWKYLYRETVWCRPYVWILALVLWRPTQPKSRNNTKNKSLWTLFCLCLVIGKFHNAHFRTHSRHSKA